MNPRAPIRFKISHKLQRSTNYYLTVGPEGDTVIFGSPNKTQQNSSGFAWDRQRISANNASAKMFIYNRVCGKTYLRHRVIVSRQPRKETADLKSLFASR